MAETRKNTGLSRSFSDSLVSREAMKRRKSMKKRVFAILVFLLPLLLIPGQTVAMPAQKEAPTSGSILRGTVTTVDGQPLPGVKIYTIGSPCCSSTESDSKGKFQIEARGSVLHLWKDGFEPQIRVVNAADGELHVAMNPNDSDIILRPCRKSKVGEKQIGYGIRFVIPKRKVIIQGGKWDVDYVVYRITAKKDTQPHPLELWFGVYAISGEPDDQQITDSVTFRQRNIVIPDHGVSGVDTRGQWRAGGNWRHTAMAAQGGAIYRDASPQEAAFYDRIIDSLCFVPSRQ
jgi:hypothetical protein